MRLRLLVRCLAVLLPPAFLLAGTPLAAQPALTGPEFFVAPPDPAVYQDEPVVARDATGRLMVIWIESPEGQQSRLHGRVFDAAGRPETPAFILGTGAHSVVKATLAPAAPEGFLVAWQTSEWISPTTRRRIFARRLSPSGRPRGDLVQVRGPVNDFTAFMWIGPMLTASASDGSFIVAWTDFNPLTYRYDVFFRPFDTGGRPLATVALLPNEGGLADRRPAALTVLDDGEIRIAWKSWSIESSTMALWVGRFDRTGAPLAAPVRLPLESLDSWTSAVAFGPDGGCLTAWAGGFRAFAPDGTPFSPQPATVSFLQPRVTAEPGGTFLVSGERADGICAIAGLQLEADGTPLGPVGCLTNPPTERASPSSITGTKSGGFALIWSEYGRSGVPSGRCLFGQSLATTSPGTVQIERAHSTIPENASEPLKLRILRRDGTAGTVSVDYRLTGAATGGGTVIFPDGDSTPRIVSIPVSDDDIPGSDRIVRVALLRPTGGAVLGLPRRAVVEVRDDDEPSPLLARAEPPLEVAQKDLPDAALWSPDLAASPGGAFEVVWRYRYRHPSSGPVLDDFAVQGQHFDADAHPTASFENRCQGEPGRVRLAMHPAGGSRVYWEEGGFSFSQKVDALGAAAGPVVSLGFSIDDAAPLPKGRFVAVGRDHDAAGDGLFAHFLTIDNADRRSPVLVTREALQPGSPAAVATDSTGRSIVVWAVAPTGAGPAGIFVRRFNAQGIPLGPAFRVSRWTGHDVTPSVAADSHGNFAVAWRRGWTGIYARSFSAAGTPLSDELPVNSRLEWSSAAPSVALTGDGRFAVLWQSLSGVAGQLFAGDGRRLGGTAQIDAEGLTPVVAWSDQGFFVTAYEWSNRGIAARRLPL